MEFNAEKNISAFFIIIHLDNGAKIKLKQREVLNRGLAYDEGEHGQKKRDYPSEKES